MPGTFVGTGTTITFGTSGYQAQLLDVAWDGIERAAVNSSHMGTTDWHTFIPVKLVDPGEIKMEIAHDPDDYPPTGAAAETVTVTFPLQDSGNTTPASWVVQAFIMEYEIGVPLEDKMTATITLKCSGSITTVDES